MNTDYEELEQLPEDDPLLGDLLEDDGGDSAQSDADPLELVDGVVEVIKGAKYPKALTGKLLMLRKVLKKGE